ncbi:hypothetical protein BC829DRAFT_388687, partial [Chytridium lagenaria]
MSKDEQSVKAPSTKSEMPENSPPKSNQSHPQSSRTSHTPHSATPEQVTQGIAYSTTSHKKDSKDSSR